MSIDKASPLFQAYCWHRIKAGKPAYAALEAARRDVEEGRKRHASFSAKLGKPFKAYGGMMLWIENPDDVGLRMVGDAHNIVRLDHTGWYCDNFGDGPTATGVVLQLPGRNRRPRFLAGIADPHNDGPVLVDVGTIWEGEEVEWIPPRDGWGGYWAWTDNPREHDGCRSAAREADRLAERYAETEREYNMALAAGCYWRHTVDEMQAERASVRALLAERKAAKTDSPSYPTICAAIRRVIVEKLERIRNLRERRDALASGDYSEGWNFYSFSLQDPSLVSAFNEGAGQTVISLP